MNKTLLYRMDLMENENEINSIQKYWKDNSFNFRSNIPENKTVIGRYSVLPYYKELENELKLKNCELINSYKQHQFISKMIWYDVVKDYTPKTFFHMGYNRIPDFENGYIAKGETNSRKFQWDTCMYAKDKSTLKNVLNNLLQDTLISQQSIVIREFIPLETIEIGINGMPISNEWRFFFYGKELVSHGFYWSIIENHPLFDDNMLTFAKKIGNIISEYTNFFVLDIVKTKNGDFILIEINDGQMSGLSSINSDVFYKNLYDISHNIPQEYYVY